MVDQYFYAVYDLKAKQIAFNTMQIIPSDEAAARWFADMIRHGGDGNIVARHPEDFVLVRVGLIDQDTLSIKSYGVGAAEPVVTGVAITRVSEQTQEPVEQPLEVVA